MSEGGPRSPTSRLLGPQRLRDAEFTRRHDVVSRILVAQVPVVLLVGLLHGSRPAVVAVWLAVVATLALVAMAGPASRIVRVLGAVAGLLLACTAVVHLAGGLAEAHLYFLVALTGVAFYRDLRIVGLTVLYVAVLNIGLAVSEPAWVGTANPSPWALAAVRTGFLLGIAAFYTYAWRHSDRDRGDRDELRDRLADQLLRQRQALQINDTIVQGLATAHYALELGETDMAADSVERALSSARGLITDLLGDDAFGERRSLVRDVAASPRDDAFQPAVALSLTMLSSRDLDIGGASSAPQAASGGRIDEGVQPGDAAIGGAMGSVEGAA